MARTLIVLAFLLAACSSRPPVPEVLGQCRMDAIRSAGSGEDADTKAQEFVFACMSAHGYEFDYSCSPYSSQTIAACFKAA
jgi:hypothetical protein